MNMIQISKPYNHVLLRFFSYLKSVEISNFSTQYIADTKITYLIT